MNDEQRISYWDSHKTYGFYCYYCGAEKNGSRCRKCNGSAWERYIRMRGFYYETPEGFLQLFIG